MKKLLISVSIITILFLSACQNNVAKEGIYQESGNTLNVHEHREDIYNESKDTKEDFGFVRYVKSESDTQNKDINKITVNREKLANIISEYCTTVPNVYDVSTLVTSKEVLIVYDTNSADPELTADQVKKTAKSIIPRWYNVYVSDNINLRQDIQDYARKRSNDKGVQKGIESIIEEMKKSPQGEEEN